VINFHGLWKKGFGKGDCPDRLRQSEKIKAVIEEHAEPVILMGDFNLHPETESLSLLKKNLRDLIIEFQIPGTRSQLYPKPERFADYALISPEYQIESFEVPQNFDGSDHLPLILRIK
jgi:endonuclease/exonuclease/phosphatase family metal-dependent hydrolase